MLAINKKLSYRRATARRSLLVNSWYVSRGHSKALPFDRLHTISHITCLCLAQFLGYYPFFPKFKEVT